MQGYIFLFQVVSAKRKWHNVLTETSKIVVLCLCVLHVRRKNCLDVEEARESERDWKEKPRCSDSM